MERDNVAVWWKRDRGSLVLFLVLLMPALWLFLGFLVDLVRVKLGENLLNEGVRSGLDSILADYDRDLRGKYGIFAIGGKEYGVDFGRRLGISLGGTGMELTDHRVDYVAGLNEYAVLRRQILEEMKIRGLVNLGKDLGAVLSTFRDVKLLSGELGDYGTTREEQVRGLQEKVGSNMEVLKELESRKGAGESGLEAEIGRLYQENKDLLVLAENLSEPEGSVTEPPEVSGDALDQLGNLFGSSYEDLKGELQNPAFLYQEGKDLSLGIDGLVEEGLLGVRDRYLLSQYVLDHFPTYGNGGSGEAEKILGGGYGAYGLLQVLMLRSGLDGVGSLLYDPLAPPEVFSRFVYGAGMGLLGGISDTVRYLSEEGLRLPVLNPLGVTSNPVAALTLTYRNHLEVLLMAAREPAVVGMVYEMISDDISGAWYCGVRGRATVRMDLWFLTFLPDGMRFLGGVVDDGGVILSEDVVSSFT